MIRWSVFCSLFLLLFLKGSQRRVQEKTLIPLRVISPLMERYSEEEKILVEADLTSIRSLAFRGRVPTGRPIYIATTGGPGSRKTTILEKYLADHPVMTKNAVYLDPDQRALKFMVHTYIARSLSNLDVYKSENLEVLRRTAYTYWRDASNYIANTLLNEAYQGRYDIAHGTTFTGAAVPEFLQNLQEAGYTTTLLLCFAPETFVENSIEYRNEKIGFFQASYQDIAGKNTLFPQRMQTYFTNADHLVFFWSETLGDEIQPCATWTRGHPLTIQNQIMYDKIISYYETFQKGHPTFPTWQQLGEMREGK